MAKRQPPKKHYDVQPLRTTLEIEEMKEALRKWCSERDRFLFVFGINTGLRISDIVRLKVKDVRGKKYAIITEQKTGKVRRIRIQGQLAEEIEAYTKGMDDEDYLFPSRRKDGKSGGHITPTQAYRQLVKAGEMLGRKDIGTHTMRKTFGYHYYKRTKDIATLMQIFNHSAPSITKRYIGITQEEIDESLKDFFL